MLIKNTTAKFRLDDISFGTKKPHRNQLIRLGATLLFFSITKVKGNSVIIDRHQSKSKIALRDMFNFHYFHIFKLFSNKS